MADCTGIATEKWNECRDGKYKHREIRCELYICRSHHKFSTRPPTLHPRFGHVLNLWCDLNIYKLTSFLPMLVLAIPTFIPFFRNGFFTCSYSILIIPWITVFITPNLGIFLHMYTYTHSTCANHSITLVQVISC